MIGKRIGQAEMQHRHGDVRQSEQLRDAAAGAAGDDILLDRDERDQPAERAVRKYAHVAQLDRGPGRRVRKAKIVAVGVEEMHAGSEIAQFYRASMTATPPRSGVSVLNLPNSRSTRARADGQAERLLLAWTGLRCRDGRATEGVACGRPRVRSRPWRRLSPRPDGEDRERRRSQLVFDGRRALSCTRERDRQD